MSPEKESKVPVWFWVLAVLLMVWNLAGVMAYIGHVSITSEALAEMTEAERNLIKDVPAWATGAFAIAVFAGALGSAAMLLRKGWSFYLFCLSLLGVIAQMTHTFFMSNALEVQGSKTMIMPVMIIGAAIFLVWFSHWTKGKGWLT